jgi:hypothetical protein
MAIITLNNNSLLDVTSLPAGVGGKVLQVSDMAIISSTQAVATATYTDLTGFNISITPSSTSSKIFMCANIETHAPSTLRGYGLKFFRNTTEIYASGQLYSIFYIDGSARQIASWNYIDSPNTTSSTTYKVQVATYNGDSLNFNQGSQSTFYLMEIAG